MFIIIHYYWFWVSNKNLYKKTYFMLLFLTSDWYVNQWDETTVTDILIDWLMLNLCLLCWCLCWHSYRLPKGELIDVSGKHRAGWENRRVCWRHHCSWHRPQTKEGDVRWTKVLKHYGKDHIWLVLVLRRDGPIRGLVPVWKRKKCWKTMNCQGLFQHLLFLKELFTASGFHPNQDFPCGCDNENRVIINEKIWLCNI